MDNDFDGLTVTARTGDPIAIARLLVATPSVNPELEAGGTGEAAVAAVAADLLRGWGLETEVSEVAEGRPNVLAILDGEGPTLLLNGHLDTVGVSGMTVPPFAARIEGARLVGRGSSDMKGGVAALLAATSRLAAAGPRPKVIVALTADEEHASLGMAALVDSGLRADLAVVCEPTSLAVMPAHKGFVWIRGAFRGVAAHGSRPESGVDAIRHAALFLAALDERAGEILGSGTHPLLGGASMHTGTISGGTAPSVYPESCEVLIEVRTLPGETGAAVLDGAERVLDGVRAGESALDASLEITLERPGTEVAVDSDVVRRLVRAGEAHGAAPPIEGMTAWVDAAFLNEAGIPAVCYGPGDTARAHTAGEWIEVSEIETCADVLETLARGLAEAGGATED